MDIWKAHIFGACAAIFFATAQFAHSSQVDDLKRLAAEGNPNAQYSLATDMLYGITQYPDGSKPERDVARAIALLESLAAYSGDNQVTYRSIANLTLGQIYFDGSNFDDTENGHRLDWWKAAGYFMKIPEPDDASTSDYVLLYKQSQYYMGRISLQEEDLFRTYYSLDEHFAPPQNFGAAAAHFTRALAPEIPKAQYYLASLYAKGSGVVQNHEKARSMLVEIADKGYRDALYPLGLLSIDMGDNVQALQWFILAAARDDTNAQPDAIKQRDELTQALAPSDVARAQVMATEWDNAH